MAELSTKVARAMHFARMAHEGQTRKYTGEPYVNHPIAVMGIVAGTGVHGLDEDVLAAALLHDVIEDTRATYAELLDWFGHRVAEMVDAVSDKSERWMGNRARRKEIDRLHLAKASPEAKTVKLADLIDNTRSIVLYDPDFARVYIREKELTMEVLREGDKDLWELAFRQIESARKELDL